MGDRPGRSGGLAAAVLAACLLLAGCSPPAARAGPGDVASPGPGRPAGGGHRASARPFPAAENTRRGTRAWRITDRGTPGAIEGFADRVSVLPGQPFRLYVSTTSASFRVQAFRMGWYHGARARQVWESGPVAGHRQAGPVIAPATHLVTAPWRPSLTVATGGWPPGAYLLRLDAARGAQRYVPITVRSPATAGRVVLLLGTTTWQAYNTWGGYSLYAGPAGRAFAVSFDRPYDGDGASLFLAFDEPPIALAERTAGLPLAYETGNDLAADPHLLAGARAVISLGHDEYYSASMRAALTAARAAGTNLAFLGANAIYRHIRWASSPLGADRVIICYKAATLDPMYGRHDSATTQDWRDPPDPRPESVLTGVFYECNPVSAPYVVYDPGNWIFAGTGVRRGTSFPGLVGPEYDRVDPAVPFPRPLEVLAHSPLACGGVSSYSDSAYYTVPGGAGVFASGTMRWVCAMRGPVCGHGVSRAAQAFVDRATQNLLRAFAAGPAGLAHPAHSNLAAVRPAAGAAY
ncbi:MAG TPA: N,N-dimethylformamidase beta subunit family domain-containing protein [Streptosporangiaceae bacterium]